MDNTQKPPSPHEHARSGAITVKNITRTFTRSNETAAVKSASFTIPDGSFTIIYGPSGSGKSTLLNCLVGLDQPSKGTVAYDGKDLYQLSPNERAYFRAHTLGMVYQSNFWVKSLTVLENVAMPLTFLGASAEDAKKGAMDSLARINMQQYARAYPFNLSGGEQQRVAMARATVNNPSYLVADEPTGNLDSQSGDAVIDLLRYYNRTLLRTVVLVTHNLAYLPIATQLLTIEDGIVKEVGGADRRAVIERLLADTEHRMDQWRQA